MNCIDIDKTIEKEPILKKAYDNFCADAYEKHDKCNVWIDEDGEDWWLNLQHPFGQPNGIDHGFRICSVNPTAREAETIIGRVLIAIGKGRRFLNNLKKT